MKKITFRLFSLLVLGCFIMPMGIGCTSNNQPQETSNDDTAAVPDTSAPAEETTEEAPAAE